MSQASDSISLYEQRAKNAKEIFDVFDLFEQENDAIVPENFHYIFTPGIRFNSELMWAVQEECFYVSNGKIVNDDGDEAFTCYQKKCSARVYLKQNGFAYCVKSHTIAHGSMYALYIQMKCRNTMREQCLTAGPSKTINDIYND